MALPPSRANPAVIQFATKQSIPQQPKQIIAPSLIKRNPTQPALKPLVQNGNTSTAEEGLIMKNSYILQPNRIIGSDFLTRPILLQLLRKVLYTENPDQPLFLGEGVSEIMSSTAYEKLWYVITRIGKAAETRISPGEGLKVNYLQTNTDEIRKELNVKDEKKPKEIHRDGKRIRISMTDVMFCKKFLPERSLHRYETKKYKSGR
ncbi:hypothetical protein EDI_342170 [Entamoeba dispar SAW760]|uniref:Uncharacterized protein n=1 Tax=Entamoeba dispar (strain ATCC PRA-260 / SAW760) TaxID=370354 RepID=B0E9P9_ENTDS|nr:uncharacterized protein EDI_342170 [Entamoeba dispar SAW760]EDR28767.1 hypothetical protein EDI_342170 [Entamoeba dispar SAW760]|eukprot:EDR28767.1 hypothetical protein EDI_342170 [Entamoeba dispar SAW760]